MKDLLTDQMTHDQNTRFAQCKSVDVSASDSALDPPVSRRKTYVPCFTAGTLIATPRGEVPVEELQAGDRVITRDNGIQTITWAGQKRVNNAALTENPELRPIEIKAGALGDNLPERDIQLSPTHRVLIVSALAKEHFNESEVLVAAKHMLAMEGVGVARVAYTTYYHFMCATHELVLSDGIWTESFQPSDYSLKGVDDDQRKELFTLFPELESPVGLGAYGAARRVLKQSEASALIGA